MSRSAAVPSGDSLRALDPLAGGGTIFACSLCGSRFTHEGRACGACPMSNGCDLVRCPNCGFQFPRSSRIADGLSRIWNRWRNP